MLMYNIRNISKQKGIEIIPCKNVFEMFSNFQENTSVILIEKVDKFLNCEVTFTDKFNKKVYFVDDYKIYNATRDLVFENIEEFFDSNVFKISSSQSLFDNEKIISKKFDELGIGMNTWISRFIKNIISEMRKRNITKVNKQLIEEIGKLNELKCKNIYDSIRPTLKKYATLINEKTKSNVKNSGVKQILDLLYAYCFESNSN